MKNTRNWLIVYLLAVAGWLLLSIVFRMDRLYGDAAFYLFNCINELKIFIAHDRPVSFVVQWIPLLLAEYKADINLIVAAFSFSESVTMVLYSAIPILILKDYKLALSSLLPLYTGVKWNYFNPVSELVLCIPLFIVTIGLLYRYLDKLWMNISFLILSVFFIYNHPLFYLILPVSYILIILKQKPHQIWTIIHSAVMIIFIVYKLMHSDDYEDSQMVTGDYFNLYQIFSTYSSWNSLQKLIISYGCLALLLIVVCLTLVLENSKRVFLYSVSILLGITFGVLFKFHHLFPHTYEPFERYLLPVSMFTGVLFYITEVRRNYYISFLVSIIILVQFLFILDYGKLIKLRNMQVKNVIHYAQRNQLSKVLVHSENFAPWFLGHTWSLTGESLIYSKGTGNGHTVQIALVEEFDPELLSRISPEEYVHYPWWAINIKYLNHDYFRLKSQPFVLINTDDTLSNLDKQSLDFITAELSSNKLGKQRDHKKLNITLLNSGMGTFHSGTSNDRVSIGGHWLKNDLPVAWIGEVRLLADLEPGVLSQLIKVKTPSVAGTYDLQFYIRINDFMPIKLNVQSHIEIK